MNDINNSVAQGEFKTHFRDVDGFIDSKQLQEYVDANTEIYICGGNSFLNSMIMQLQTLDIPQENVHFETFIPRLSFSASSQA